MADQAFLKEAWQRLKDRYGEVHCPLHYNQPHELAIAVILSAQCTDEQVNKTTPALFKKYTNPEDFIKAPLAQIEKLIYSTGFYKNKAKSIKGFCRSLVEEHGGKIPQTMQELVRMPGVGRKTANVILQELFGQADGIVVDTHVARLSKVLGLSKSSDPVKIERDLMEILPREYWLDWSLYMIFLGRSNCTAKKVMCVGCCLSHVCPSSALRIR